MGSFRLWPQESEPIPKENSGQQLDPQYFENTVTCYSIKVANSTFCVTTLFRHCDLTPRALNVVTGLAESQVSPFSKPSLRHLAPENGCYTA